MPLSHNDSGCFFVILACLRSDTVDLATVQAVFRMILSFLIADTIICL